MTEITDRDTHVDLLVEASGYFTLDRHRVRRPQGGPICLRAGGLPGSQAKAATDDFLDAIRQTRPTLSKEMIEVFEGDVEGFVARY